MTDESSVQSQALDESRSFAKKNRAIQAAVLIAGITMNVLFAWVLLTAGYLVGSPSSVDGTNYPERIRDAKLLVSMVRPESPAAQAGLKAGDEIRSIGEASEIIQSPDAKQVSDFIAPRIGKNINFSVVRGVEPLTVSVSPIAGIIPDAGAIGIGMDTIGTLRLPIHLAILEGTRFTWNMTKLVFTGTLGFLKDAILGKADLAAVSGPIGIAGLVGEARGMGWSYVVTFTAFISVNLAVLNVLPLPALDGGRLLFVALEAIFRRRIPAKVAGITNAVGFALLIALMVFVTYRDIVKLI